MVIVVEGYDASGKSTLAQALAEKLGLVVHEAGPKPKDDEQAMKDSYYQLSLNNHVLCRITPISRQAYQLDSTLKHRTDLSRVIIELAKKGVIFIYCVGESDNHDVKEYDTPEHLKYLEEYGAEIKARYDTLFKGIDHIKYDFRIDDMEKFVCKIQSHFSKPTAKYGTTVK